VPERTEQPPDQPSPSPWSPPPGRILSEPGTVETCRVDYDQGAGVRHTLAAQEARTRR
jgi:hypothetical protein